MSMAKEMVSGFYLHHTTPQGRIPPMGSSRLVENHNRRLVGDNDVCIIRNQFFRMVIGQSEELHSAYLTSAILKEMDISGQVFYSFCIS